MVEAVKNTIKCWNSQVNCHSLETLLCDVNCCKRDHSWSTLLHLHACMMDITSPASHC